MYLADDIGRKPVSEETEFPSMHGGEREGRRPAHGARKRNTDGGRMMKKYGIILAAALTAAAVTACGSGDGIVINGTTAAESQLEETGELPQEGMTETEQGESASGSGTKIEIVTGETTAAQEPASESLEGQTEPETAAPTEAPKPQPSTTAATKAPETTAAKQYAVTDVSKKMYATTSVRVRSSYSTSSEVLGSLASGEEIQVTGESENGWMRVDYKGHTAYVSKSYLSDTRPAAESSAQTSQTTAASGGTGTTPTSPSGTAPTSAQPTTAAASGTSSVTGSITALDPSGMTVQGSDGSSYQFVWGTSVPALAPGERVQVQYRINSAGQREVTQITK